MAEFELGQKYSVSEDAVLGSLEIKNGPTKLKYLPDGILEVVGGIVATTADPSMLANFGNVVFQPGNGGPAIQGNIYNTWSDVVTVADQMNVNGHLIIWLDFTYATINGIYNDIHIGGITGPAITFKTAANGFNISGGGPYNRAIFDPGFSVNPPVDFLTDLYELDGPFVLQVNGNQHLPTMLFSASGGNILTVKNYASLEFNYAVGSQPVGMVGNSLYLNVHNCGPYFGLFQGPLTFAGSGGIGMINGASIAPIALQDGQSVQIHVTGGGWVGDINAVGLVIGVGSVPSSAGVYMQTDCQVDPVQFTNPQYLVSLAGTTLYFNETGDNTTTTTEMYNDMSYTVSSLTPPVSTGSTSYRVRDLLNYLATPLSVTLEMADIPAQVITIPASSEYFPSDGLGIWNPTYNFIAAALTGGPSIDIANNLFPCTVRVCYNLLFATSNARATGDYVSIQVNAWNVTNVGTQYKTIAAQRGNLDCFTPLGITSVNGSMDVYLPGYISGSPTRFDLSIFNNTGSNLILRSRQQPTSSASFLTSIFTISIVK